MLAALAGRIYDNAPQQNAFPVDSGTNWPPMLRSIGSVVAGLLTQLLVKLPVQYFIFGGLFTRRQYLTEWELWILAIGSVAAAGVGSYVTARLAPSRPRAHAAFAAFLPLLLEFVEPGLILQLFFQVAGVLVAWLAGSRLAKPANKAATLHAAV